MGGMTSTGPERVAVEQIRAAAATVAKTAAAAVRALARWLAREDVQEVLAAALARHPSARGRAPATLHAPCHCHCTRAHPGDPGICEPALAVVTRRFVTGLLGPVDVPLCAPCAIAQGLAELAAAAG